MSFLSKGYYGKSMQSLRDRLAGGASNRKNNFVMDAIDRMLAAGKQQPNAGATPAAQSAPLAQTANTMSPNDPRSMADPRMRSNVSKILLGQ